MIIRPPVSTTGIECALIIAGGVRLPTEERDLRWLREKGDRLRGRDMLGVLNGKLGERDEDEDVGSVERRGVIGGNVFS